MASRSSAFVSGALGALFDFKLFLGGLLFDERRGWVSEIWKYVITLIFFSDESAKIVKEVLMGLGGIEDNTARR